MVALALFGRFACTWHLTGTFAEDDNNWIVAYGHVDSDNVTLYIAAYYWAIYTMVSPAFRCPRAREGASSRGPSDATAGASSAHRKMEPGPALSLTSLFIR